MTTVQTQPTTAAPGPRNAGRAGLPFRPHVVAAVLGRDFFGFFTNPAGYVFVTLFLVVCSCAQFWQPAFFADNLANLEPLNRWMPFILLIFVPAVTMSMWAEERKQGTDELLLTLPARDVEVVLGKFLAAVGITTVALAFLALGCAVMFAGVKLGPFPIGRWSLPELGIGGLGRPDQGVFLATFLGYWLMALMMIAVGMVASMLSGNVTVAYILGGLACALPVFAGSLSRAAIVDALALVLCLAGLALVVGGLRLVSRATAGGSPEARVRSSWRRGGLLAALLAGPLLIGAGLLLYPGLPWRGLDQSVPKAVGGLIERMSIPAQFRDFGSGVIRLTGVLYFLAMAGAMLYLNMVLLGRRHWAGGATSAGRWGHAVVRVAAVVVGLISLVTLVGRWGDARVDATEERLHTLSPITARLVREIPADRPVYIQAFVSPEVPREFVQTKANLLNTLKELQALGGDRIRLSVVETRRYSAEAREAEKRFGIAGRRVPTTRDGQQTVEEITLGVAFTSGLEQVVIPFFDRGLPVEYELARSIRVAGGSRRRRVGVLETDARLLGGTDFRAQGQEPEWAIVTELKKQYDVQAVSPASPIPFEEEQSISLAGEPTGGTFTLRFGDETTPPIPFDATPVAVSDALAALKSIGGQVITAGGGPLPKSPVRVSFGGRLAGRDVPELVADSSGLTGGTKPTAKVGTTVQVLEALVVAQPSTLTPPQVEHLVEYVRKGGPTLLLLDPAPMTNLAIAPQILRMPAGAMPPPPPGSLDPLFRAIGLEWPDTEIVWNAYNPHQQFEMPMEYVIIGQGNGARAPFADDPTTARLQEVFLLFPGLIRDRAGVDGPRWTPLLMTSEQGGTLRFDEIIELAPFGMSRLRPNRPHFPAGRPFTVAARIGGKPAVVPGPPGEPEPARPAADAELRVIAIADLDLISDPIFELRRKLTEAYDDFEFDNVPFVLNCVDALAGDETFIELRKKRPRHRTLTALEAESTKFVEQAQAEQRKAEETATAQLEAARTRLREAVDQIRNSKELDQRTKESMVRYREQVEQRRLALAEQEIQDRKGQAIRESKDRQEEATRAIQHRIGAQAAVLTPLPALLLGGAVFFLRNRRENLGANPDRLA